METRSLTNRWRHRLFGILETTDLGDGLHMVANGGGNVLVSKGDDGVLVIDSGMAFRAKDYLAITEKLAPAAKRKVLFNTHWHMDHNYGNAAYAEAFPGVTIVSQAQTAKMMALREPAELTDYRKGIAAYQQQYDTGKDAAGQPLSELGKADLKTAIAGSAVVWKEFQNLKPRYPNLTFEHELDLDLGGRTVELKFLGRGNTSGDSVAYLPKEKILVTGDVASYPIPYFTPPLSQHAKSLRKLAQIDADAIIPGHGPAWHDKNFLNLEADLFESIVNTAHTTQPGCRFVFNRAATATPDDIRRWYPHPAAVAR